ncbi:hypothetical protein IW150_006405 [Coemansia sp. RSA 2607]|nr:hypothetical protein IW150_006405 [Coemansia sp. RSA 2607]
MPEGAVYEYLHQKKVVSVPQVFASGILIRELCEYRLEFLILENCGYDLNSYIKTRCHRHSDEEFYDMMTDIVRQTFACLVQAKHHGVLHRDISVRNIAVKKTLHLQNERLFFVDGEFVGSCLVVGDTKLESKRNLDDDFVRFFIGDAAFEKIFQRLPESPAVQSEATPELPVNDLTITNTFTASITLSRSTSTTRKRAMDDDSGDTTPKRQCQ